MRQVFPLEWPRGMLCTDEAAHALVVREGTYELADWTRGEPAYLQVAEGLRQKIRSGELVPGQQLPSYSELMRDYDVSITVARSAVGELRAEGLVTTHQGKGAFVLEGAAEAAVPRDSAIASLRRELDALAKRVARLEGERADPR